MRTGLLLGAAMGSGALLVLRALLPARVPLSVAITQFGQSPRAGDTAGPPHPHLRNRLGSRGLAHRFGPDRDLIDQWELLSGTPVTDHVRAKFIWGWLGLVVPVVGAVAASAGGASIPWGLVMVAAGAAGLAGFLIPDVALRRAVHRSQRQFRHALAVYMDLVVIIMAGGGGTETALFDASRSGSGRAFEQIRRALDSARLEGRPPWGALAALGERSGVDELVELAASASLAGEQGAKVRASLSAKAASLRTHQLAELETQAQEATERMSAPVALLLFGFLAFVLYPALQLVMDGLS